MRLTLLLILITACNESGSAPPDAAGTSELSCESGDHVFPALDKTCTRASDCFIARHMVSCCGTLIAVGLNTSSQSVFETTEAACAADFPACGCASQPTAAEDGRTEENGTIEVDCREQRCTTFVP